MSRVAKKQFSGFLTRSDTDRAVQPQKKARGLKFWIKKEEGLHFLCGEIKSADQLRGQHAADLRFCCPICKRAGFLMMRLTIWI